MFRWYEQVSHTKVLNFLLKNGVGVVQTLLLTSCVTLGISLSILEPVSWWKDRDKCCFHNSRREPVKDGPGIVGPMYLHLDCGCFSLHLHCPRGRGYQDRTTRLLPGVLRALVLSVDWEPPSSVMTLCRGCERACMAMGSLHSWASILGQLTAPVLSPAELGLGFRRKGSMDLGFLPVGSFHTLSLCLYSTPSPPAIACPPPTLIFLT